jgi:CheY-like chemotaxis protein
MQGLAQLSRRHYELVVSDYAMPGATGTWMLDEAARCGLMGGTVAMIVTAHAEEPDVAAFLVLAKPVDLDDFLETIQNLVARGAAASATGYRALPAKTSPIEASAPDSSARSRAKQKRM